MGARRLVSLVAERAVRYLEERKGPVGSVEMAREVLFTKVQDEPTATRVLEAAFGGDPRLRYRDGNWERRRAEASVGQTPASSVPSDEPPRALVLLQGERPERGRPFRLSMVAGVRIERGMVVTACGGSPAKGAGGHRLRRKMVEMLDGAVTVMEDPPGARIALERWLGEPIHAPVSLRRLARNRLGLRANDLETLASRLGVSWRGTDDLLERAEAMDACLSTLRRPGESLTDLRAAASGAAPPIDWSRFEFSRDFLHDVPGVPGTYRFYDRAGGLLYVGKSKNLRRRLASYFREGQRRSARVQALLDSLCRIEVEPLGSDLEAVLNEAADIRRRKPSRNVQRNVRTGSRHRERLRSILILEPASPPAALLAYLLRDGKLLDKVALGPRGAGLKRIHRLLRDHYFGMPEGPTPPSGPDVEVEVVARWLAANQDRAVAFDPTNLGSPEEVIDRLRWFLENRSLRDPDGSPITFR